MIGGFNTISYTLANIYNDNNAQLDEVYGRLSSGKKVLNPSDDFAGYARAQSLSTDVTDWENVKEKLQEARAASEAAVEFGNELYEDLVDLKSLVGQYYDVTATATEPADRTVIRNQITALYNDITTAIGNTKYESTAIYTSGTLDTVNLDPDGTSLTIAMTAPTLTSATTINQDLSGSGGAAGGFLADYSQANDATNESNNTTNLDDAIADAALFIGEAEGFTRTIDRQMDMADTIIQNKKASISLITDINEAEETANAVDLQIRQQAAMSVMAQANMLRGGIVRLYDSL